MINNSKALSVLLSLCIAVITTLLFAILTALVSAGILLTVFVSTTLAAIAIIYVGLERFVFRRLKKFTEDLRTMGLEVETAGDATEDVLLDPFGKVTNALEAYTMQKQTQIDRLKKLEAFRADFIADISHELKTPIFAAQGFVHTLLDGAVEEKNVRKKFLKKAAKSLDGLDMLVQDLLTLSQIETGQIKMRFEDVDLYALTEEVFEQFKGKHNKKDVALRIEGRVRKVVAWADRQRIFQVMTNLISNAIKHSHQEGEVIVSFGVRERSVITRVRDFGEGIPAEHIHRIFERFYRVDKSRSREKGGTGLGLAIVKHILEGHKSRAVVESEPGKGSTFSFKLPRPGIHENGNTEHRGTEKE